MDKEFTTIIGTDQLGTSLGVLLARVNWPLRGLWDLDHEKALTSALVIGCSAFSDWVEPVANSTLIICCLDSPEIQASIVEAAPPGALVAVWGDQPPGGVGFEPLSCGYDVDSLVNTSFDLAGSDEAIARFQNMLAALGCQV